uniref:(northern house mosquito) hypothetical protein n=1 Tax=Culex pipiens TaxID=7175 RepID=A0A8D8NU98_CULPI
MHWPPHPAARPNHLPSRLLFQSPPNPSSRCPRSRGRRWPWRAARSTEPTVPSEEPEVKHRPPSPVAVPARPPIRTVSRALGRRRRRKVSRHRWHRSSSGRSHVRVRWSRKRDSLWCRPGSTRS